MSILEKATVPFPFVHMPSTQHVWSIRAPCSRVSPWCTYYCVQLLSSLSSVSATLNIIISFTLSNRKMMFGSLFYEFFIKIKSGLILWALPLSSSNGFDLKHFVLMIVILKMSCCFQACVVIIINTDGANGCQIAHGAYGRRGEGEQRRGKSLIGTLSGRLFLESCFGLQQWQVGSGSSH